MSFEAGPLNRMHDEQGRWYSDQMLSAHHYLGKSTQHIHMCVTRIYMSCISNCDVTFLRIKEIDTKIYEKLLFVN